MNIYKNFFFQNKYENLNQYNAIFNISVITLSILFLYDKYKKSNIVKYGNSMSYKEIENFLNSTLIDKIFYLHLEIYMNKKNEFNKFCEDLNKICSCYSEIDSFLYNINTFFSENSSMLESFYNERIPYNEIYKKFTKNRNLNTIYILKDEYKKKVFPIYDFFYTNILLNNLSKFFQQKLFLSTEEEQMKILYVETLLSYQNKLSEFLACLMNKDSFTVKSILESYVDINFIEDKFFIAKQENIFSVMNPNEFSNFLLKFYKNSLEHKNYLDNFIKLFSNEKLNKFSKFLVKEIELMHRENKIDLNLFENIKENESDFLIGSLRLLISEDIKKKKNMNKLLISEDIKKKKKKNMNKLLISEDIKKKKKKNMNKKTENKEIKDDLFNNMKKYAFYITITGITNNSEIKDFVKICEEREDINSDTANNIKEYLNNENFHEYTLSTHFINESKNGFFKKSKNNIYHLSIPDNKKYKEFLELKNYLQNIVTCLYYLNHIDIKNNSISSNIDDYSNSLFNSIYTRINNEFNETYSKGFHELNRKLQCIGLDLNFGFFEFYNKKKLLLFYKDELQCLKTRFIEKNKMEIVNFYLEKYKFLEKKVNDFISLDKKINDLDFLYINSTIEDTQKIDFENLDLFYNLIQKNFVAKLKYICNWYIDNENKIPQDNETIKKTILYFLPFKELEFYTSMSNDIQEKNILSYKECYYSHILNLKQQLHLNWNGIEYPSEDFIEVYYKKIAPIIDEVQNVSK